MAGYLPPAVKDETAVLMIRHRTLTCFYNADAPAGFRFSCDKKIWETEGLVGLPVHILAHEDDNGEIIPPPAKVTKTSQD